MDMEKSLIDRMKEYAETKHNQPSDCQRYGNKPYSSHLEDVVATGKQFLYYIPKNDHEDVLCALNGHDLVEDTDVSVNDIEKLFNTRIADLIFRVSNERGWNRKEKNFKTYPKIWVKEYAIFIKLCDRISNTRNSKNSGHRMYKVYREEYPVFRYALKIKNLYPDMWKELDALNNFNENEIISPIHTSLNSTPEYLKAVELASEFSSVCQAIKCCEQIIKLDTLTDEAWLNVPDEYKIQFWQKVIVELNKMK